MSFTIENSSLSFEMKKVNVEVFKYFRLRDGRKKLCDKININFLKYLIDNIFDLVEIDYDNILIFFEYSKKFKLEKIHFKRVVESIINKLNPWKLLEYFYEAFEGDYEFDDEITFQLTNKLTKIMPDIKLIPMWIFLNSKYRKFIIYGIKKNEEIIDENEVLVNIINKLNYIFLCSDPRIFELKNDEIEFINDYLNAVNLEFVRYDFFLQQIKIILFRTTYKMNDDILKRLETKNYTCRPSYSYKFKTKRNINFFLYTMDQFKILFELNIFYNNSINKLCLQYKMINDKIKLIFKIIIQANEISEIIPCEYVIFDSGIIYLNNVHLDSDSELIFDFIKVEKLI